MAETSFSIYSLLDFHNTLEGFPFPSSFSILQSVNGFNGAKRHLVAMDTWRIIDSVFHGILLRILNIFSNQCLKLFCKRLDLWFHLNFIHSSDQGFIKSETSWPECLAFQIEHFYFIRWNVLYWDLSSKSELNAAELVFPPMKLDWSRSTFPKVKFSNLCLSKDEWIDQVEEVRWVMSSNFGMFEAASSWETTWRSKSSS